MILQALYNHYLLLLDDPDSGIAPPGYSSAKVVFEILLSKDGDILDLTFEVNKGKSTAKNMLVPEQPVRTSGEKPFFLCDKASYIFGLDKGKDSSLIITESRFKLSAELHRKILTDINSDTANSILSFFAKWKPEDWEKQIVVKDNIDALLTGGLIVFRYDPDFSLVHQRKEVMSAWMSYVNSCEKRAGGVCLITGEDDCIENVHPVIRGVKGAQSSGAAIVSFNKDSFCSYNKTQSYNSPVSKKAAAGYTTTLNYLLAQPKYHFQIGDATVVFWAESRQVSEQEDWLAYLLNPEEPELSEKSSNGWRADRELVDTIKDTLARVSKGIQLRCVLDVDKQSERFFVLGLAPNAARLSVRFWYSGSFVEISERIMQHYLDMKIIGFDGLLSINKLLLEMAVEHKYDNIPPIIGGQLMKAILLGQLYPASLLTLLIGRIRADSDKKGFRKINAARVGLIKAYLLRKARLLKQEEMEGVLTVSLNEKTTNIAYRLGRLFALLEKAQKDAIGANINATIKDRYFSSASATPASVFPLLLRLTQHHIAKVEHGIWIDKKMEEVMAEIEFFPTHLTLEEQGLFILGYYHQREALYIKKEKVKEEN